MHRYWVASFVLSVDRQAATDIQPQFGYENRISVIFARFELRGPYARRFSIDDAQRAPRLSVARFPDEITVLSFSKTARFSCASCIGDLSRE